MSLVTELVNAVESAPAELKAEAEKILQKARAEVHTLLSDLHLEEGAVQAKVETAVSETADQAAVDVDAAAHNVQDVADESASDVKA